MKSLSIKQSGPLLFLVPVLAAVVAISLVSTWHGRRLADTMAGRVTDQAAARVEVSVDSHLRNAVLVTNSVKTQIDAGELDPAKLREWRPRLYRHLAANSQVNSVTFGNPSGDATWMIRYPNELQMEYAIRDGMTDSRIVEYQVGDAGEIGRKLSAYDYDPRIRPWYKAAIAAKGSTWSPVYPWVRGDGRQPTLGIAYARLIRRDDGTIAGVLDSDISLLNVSEFLKQARTSKSGAAYLVENDGNLVGSSDGADVVGKDGQRIRAADSRHALTAAVAKAIGDFAEVKEPREIVVDSDGTRYRVNVRPLANPWDLEWKLVVVVPEEEIMAGVATMRRQAWMIGGGVAAATLVLGFLVSLSLVRPVTQLDRAVRRIGEGNLDDPVQVGGHREFVQLSDQLNRMTEGLKDRMRLRHSLGLAMEIQQQLLPAEPPRIPGLQVAGHSTYCDETGGDYYDFIEVGETGSGELIVVVGDVMGHGVAAAMLMATARGLLRSRIGEEGSIGELLTHVNDLLVEDTGGERFMTMVLILADAAKGNIRLACAGHDPPIVYDPDGDRFVDLPDEAGLPLGLYAEQQYDEVKQTGFQPGWILLAGTDGLWESDDGTGEPYGKDRIMDVIRARAAESAESISAAITADLKKFCGDAHQADDITFVLIKFGEENAGEGTL